MKLWRQCFVLAPAVRCVDAGHGELGEAPPLQRALCHCGGGRCGEGGALPWQQVAGEVEDVASVDRPLALQDSLTDVIHPVDHQPVLGGQRAD